MSVTQYDNYDEIVEAWDIDPIPQHQGTDVYGLLATLASQNVRLDVTIEELYDDRFVESASGKELEKIGALVGAERKTGESDSKFRRRIQAIFVAKASTGTYAAIVNAILTILQTGPEALDIQRPPNAPTNTVVAEIQSVAIQDSPLSGAEIENLLVKAIPVGGEIRIEQQGTFAFAGDDESLEGFNEGTWSTLLE